MKVVAFQVPYFSGLSLALRLKRKRQYISKYALNQSLWYRDIKQFMPHKDVIYRRLNARDILQALGSS